MRTIRQAVPIPASRPIVLATAACIATLLATLGGSALHAQPRLPADSARIVASRDVPGAASVRRDDDLARLPDVARGALSYDNALRLDRALRRTGRTYARLSRVEQAALRMAHDQLRPGQRLAHHDLNEAQARAIVFIALDDRGDGYAGRPGGRDDRDDRGRDDRGRDDRGRDDRGRDDDRPRACSANIDRISRDAGWIHQAIAPLRRTSTSASLSHAQELEVLVAVEERAREMAVAASRCACPAARDQAGDLLDLARTATSRHRQGITKAWMTVGDDRLARLQEMARGVEREALRCGA